MLHRGTRGITALLVCLWPAGPAMAHDLKLKNVHIQRLNRCANQLRFDVKYTRGTLAHGHVGGGNPPAPLAYTIAVNVPASGAEVPIREFRVTDHREGETKAFAVPDSARTIWDAQCREQVYHDVVIRVDSLREIPEANEGNNDQDIYWRVQQPGPLSLPSCFTAPPTRCQ